MAHTNAMVSLRHKRMDPAKSDIVARGRVSARNMHGSPLGDTSVSPLTPTSTQAMIFMQTPSANGRHYSSIRYDTVYLDV
jgi:hypothetical protein